MKLADYMTEHKLRDEDFGKLVSRDRSRIYRYRRGESFPDPETLRAIFAATGGQVTANDFFHAAVPEGGAAKAAVPA